MNHGAPTVILMAAILMFAVVRRIRRTIGFQPYRPKVLWTRTSIFILLAVLLLSAGIAMPMALASDALGILLGLILVYFAAKTTTFESRNQVWYYRPNPWLGAVLIALFIGRMAVRSIVLLPMYSQVATQSQAQVQNQAQFGMYARDPWTAGVLFILLSYYVGYAVFVSRRVRHLEHPSTSSL